MSAGITLSFRKLIELYKGLYEHQELF